MTHKLDRYHSFALGCAFYLILILAAAVCCSCRSCAPQPEPLPAYEPDTIPPTNHAPYNNKRQARLFLSQIVYTFP